jgi:type II secretory pathway pseudopilin PulG
VPRFAEEGGETLIEIMITVMVISIGLTAVVAAMGSSIVASDAHRTLASGEVVVRDFGDAIKAKAAVPVSAISYVRCPDADALEPTSYTPPANFEVVITGVEYWIPSPDPDNVTNGTWGTRSDCIAYMESKSCGATYVLCDPALDPGLVRASIQANRTDRTDLAGGQKVSGTLLVRRGNRT